MTDQDRKRAVAYLRQSITPDPNDSLSLESQARACRDHMARQGMVEIDGPFIDPGQKGWSTHRPAFLAMLDRIASGGVDVVIVYKLARLSRSLVYQESIMADIDRAGAELVSVTEPWVSTSPMVRQILGAVNEQHRRDLSDYLCSALAERARRGLTHGKPPFGYRKEDGRLVPEPAEAEIVRTMYDLAAQGLGSSMIIDQLTARGMRPRHAADWSPNTVHGILRSPVQRGATVFHGEPVVDGTHPPIIGDDQWHRVQHRLDTRRPVRRKHEHHWMEGLLDCACGATMHYLQVRTERDGQRDRVRPGRFRCTGRAVARNRRRAHQGPNEGMALPPGDVITELAIDALREVVASLADPSAVIHYLESEHAMTRAQERTQRARQQRRIDELHDQRRRLLDMATRGMVDPDLYVVQDTTLKDALASTEHDLQAIPALPTLETVRTRHDGFRTLTGALETVIAGDPADLRHILLELDARAVYHGPRITIAAQHATAYFTALRPVY